MYIHWMKFSMCIYCMCVCGMVYSCVCRVYDMSVYYATEIKKQKKLATLQREGQ